MAPREGRGRWDVSFGGDHGPGRGAAADPGTGGGEAAAAIRITSGRWRRARCRSPVQASGTGVVSPTLETTQWTLSSRPWPGPRRTPIAGLSRWPMAALRGSRRRSMGSGTLSDGGLTPGTDLPRECQILRSPPLQIGTRPRQEILEFTFIGRRVCHRAEGLCASESHDVLRGDAASHGQPIAEFSIAGYAVTHAVSTVRTATVGRASP